MGADGLCVRTEGCKGGAMSRVWLCNNMNIKTSALGVCAIIQGQIETTAMCMSKYKQRGKIGRGRGTIDHDQGGEST